MKTPHVPSQRQARIIFFLAILAAFGIGVWMMFFNKGTVAIDGEIPFGIEGISSQKTCEVRPCVLSVKPKKYHITLTKKEFYPYEYDIEVRRGKETKVSASFRFVPVVREIGELVLPVSAAPLLPQFLGKKSLENFPRDAKEVSFSASGERALLKLGKEFYSYEVPPKKLSELNFAPEMVPAWLGEEIIYLEASDGKHLLKRWNKGKPTNISTFERIFAAPKLFGSPNGKYILITEGFAGNFYLVDVQKKSRKKLEVDSSAVNPNFGNFSVVFEEGKEEKKVVAISLDTLSRTTLRSINSKNVNEFAPEKFMFFAREKGEAQGIEKTTNVTFSEVLEETKKDNTEFTIKTNLLYLMEYHAADGSSEIIAEIPLGEGEMVARLTPDPNGKKWFFEKGGKIFEVILEKE